MTPPNGPQPKGANRVGTFRSNLLDRLTLLIFATGLLGGVLFANAAPRTAWPPWPEPTLALYRFDEVEWHAPMLPPAIGFENATLQESWSEYALVRDGLSIAPVAVPVLDAAGRKTFDPGFGAVRFWFSPAWTSVQAGGKGPGGFARLLERVDLSGSRPLVQWSLYFDEAGDTLYLSGTSANGKAVDLLKSPVSCVESDWQLITLNYSPKGTELWLGDQLVAEGEGLPAPAQWQEPSLALIIGSDFGVTATAQGQFEELTTFDYWPDAEQQQFYFNGVGRQAFLGPVGSEKEEAVKQELLAAAFPQPLRLQEDEGSWMQMDFSYGTNELWLEITGVTNGEAEFVIHSPSVEPYDLFMTTNLAADVPGLNLTNWVWEVRASAGQTNPPPVPAVSEIAFYRLGTTNDADDDGLTDAFENLVSHSDENDDDSDGDGMPDGWEWNYLGTHAETASDDHDGDGVTNLDEYQSGLNPTMADTDADGWIDQLFRVRIEFPR